MLKPILRQEPPVPVIQGGYNFDEWQWWKKREGISGPPTKEQLANPTSFEWAGDRAELEKTLFADGVVQLGRVSEEWLQVNSAIWLPPSCYRD